MKLFFFKRHCSSLISSNLHKTQNPPPKQSQILHLCKSGLLFDAIRILNSINPSEITLKPLVYASLLQTCTKAVSLTHGLQIHAHVIKSGLETDRFVGNSLLSLYFKLIPDMSETRRVFDALYFRDVISWTSMITGYVRAGKPATSVALFWEMVSFGIEPNDFTVSAVVKACSQVGYYRLGRCLHGVVVSRGFDSNPVIVTALIDMYGRNHRPGDARQLFDEMIQPGAICWTSVISALTRNDMFREALGCFYLMQRCHGLFPDGFTFGTVLTACGNLGRLRQGREMHAKVVTYGLCGNVVVESSLVDMYGKCGSVDDSRRVFDRMPVKNSVSWSALLGVYCQAGEFESVIKHFREMEEADLYCFGTVLRACAGLAAVQHGKEVHCQYVRRCGWRDVIVESALVNLYAKCGCIDFARSVFIQMLVRNLITWNSMICGFAQNGQGEEALGIFDEMIKEGMKPDYISFIGVLFACSHAGLVDQGRRNFILMTKEYGIKPGIEHYCCMVDLLGRAGLLEEAENLIESAECRNDSSLWAVLLGASTTCTNSATAERIAKKMIKLEPDYHLSYVLLANVYRSVGRWDDAMEIAKLMQDRGVKKTPAKSWIESNSRLGSHLHVGDVHLPRKIDFNAVWGHCMKTRIDGSESKVEYQPMLEAGV
ncbi:putative tetratricopeptide-like helical domain-containing protein [Rosa chinensis]|uniref:Putative tetratricopeptide-like helical domain-containing protein n=1 Tax=Rosa chinensis TaxID=74649 RepID=A0A2P6S2Z3_ROSCH|nr:pentatricopeptide repeat-containing protein At1g03540 [Rosa chinensis]PRQ53042.1 putative tetratricopeptide-like helical domain-containing protein [Rosa chinensis]